MRRSRRQLPATRRPEAEVSGHVCCVFLCLCALVWCGACAAFLPFDDYVWSRCGWSLQTSLSLSASLSLPLSLTHTLSLFPSRWGMRQISAETQGQHRSVDGRSAEVPEGWLSQLGQMYSPSPSAMSTASGDDAHASYVSSRASSSVSVFLGGLWV